MFLWLYIVQEKKENPVMSVLELGQDSQDHGAPLVHKASLVNPIHCMRTLIIYQLCPTSAFKHISFNLTDNT